MLKKDIKKALLTLCFLWFVASSYAQYTVMGGNGVPYVEHRKPLDIYLVYGMNNMAVSYTSATDMAHQWYRYKTKALEAEKIPSVQNGRTSVITEVEDGCGYFVEDPGRITSYVWMIDYSRYLAQVSRLRVSDKSDPCGSLLLEIDGNIPEIRYHAPTTGDMPLLERNFEVSYKTLNMEGDRKVKDIAKTLKSSDNFFEPSIEAPYCDTDIWIKGDQYARHFNKEIALCVDDYEATAVAVRIDTALIEQEAPNINASKEGYCAPAIVRFMAIANTPTAALFNWTIYREGEESNPVARFTGEEMDYTFSQAGSFVAKVEVTDHSGTCKAESEVALKISESYLMIPNAFSPGTSPGVNDEFKVAYKSLVSFKGWIFNRWGIEMFRWTDPSLGWDGKKGGRFVPPGVYFYVIEAEGSDGIKYKEKGDINILRPKTIQEKNEGIKQ